MTTAWLAVLLVRQIKELAKSSLGFRALAFSAAANNPPNTPFAALRPSDILRSEVLSSTGLNEELFDPFDLLFARPALLIRVRDKEHDRQAFCVLRESVVKLVFVGLKLLVAFPTYMGSRPRPVLSANT
jgi:hypothetical protein